MVPYLVVWGRRIHQTRERRAPGGVRGATVPCLPVSGGRRDSVAGGRSDGGPLLIRLAGPRRSLSSTLCKSLRSWLYLLKVSAEVQHLSRPSPVGGRLGQHGPSSTAGRGYRCRRRPKIGDQSTITTKYAMFGVQPPNIMEKTPEAPCFPHGRGVRIVTALNEALDFNGQSTRRGYGRQNRANVV